MKIIGKKCPENLVEKSKSTTFASSKRKDNDSVAQLVEQQTLNLWVQGSIPCWVTIDGELEKNEVI